MNLQEIKAYLRTFAELTIYAIGWLVVACAMLIMLHDIVE